MLFLFMKIMHSSTYFTSALILTVFVLNQFQDKSFPVLLKEIKEHFHLFCGPAQDNMELELE